MVPKIYAAEWPVLDMERILKRVNKRKLYNSCVYNYNYIDIKNKNREVNKMYKNSNKPTRKLKVFYTGVMDGTKALD